MNNLSDYVDNYSLAKYHNNIDELADIVLKDHYNLYNDYYFENNFIREYKLVNRNGVMYLRSTRQPYTGPAFSYYCEDCDDFIVERIRSLGYYEEGLRSGKWFFFSNYRPTELLVKLEYDKGELVRGSLKPSETILDSNGNTMYENEEVKRRKMASVKYDQLYYSNKMSNFNQGDSTIYINAYANQFVWYFHYPGLDGVLGKTYADSISMDYGVIGHNAIGLSMLDTGKDDIVTTNELYIPEKTNIVLNLKNSQNYAGEFYTLEDLQKLGGEYLWHRLIIPDLFLMAESNFHEWNTLYIYSENTDFHFIHCMNFCGSSTNMHLGYVNIKSKEEFNTWFTEKSKISLEYSEDWYDDEW